MFKKDRIMKYSIKKFTVGIASVAIGSILFLGSNAQASDKVEENKTEVATTVNNAQPTTAAVPTNKVEVNKQQNTNENSLTTNSNNTVEKKVEAVQPANTNKKEEVTKKDTTVTKEVESNKKERTTASGLNVLDKRTTDSSNIKDLLTNIIKKNEEENAKQATNKVEVEAENVEKGVQIISKLTPEYAEAISKGYIGLEGGKYDNLLYKNAVLNPDADDDGDGILNKDELYIYKKDGKTYLGYNVHPKLADTDGDGIADNEDKDKLLWNVSARDMAMFMSLVYENDNNIENILTKDLPEGALKSNLHKMMNNELAPFWSLKKTYHQDNGLDAALFETKNNLPFLNGEKIQVLAIAGTNVTQAGDLKADAALVLGNESNESIATLDLLNSLRNDKSITNLYITGHSLGGYLTLRATAEARQKNFEAYRGSYTFNAPRIYTGLFNFFGGGKMGKASDLTDKMTLNHEITNYVTNNDNVVPKFLQTKHNINIGNSFGAHANSSYFEKRMDNHKDFNFGKRQGMSGVGYIDPLQKKLKLVSAEKGTLSATFLPTLVDNKPLSVMFGNSVTDSEILRRVDTSKLPVNVKLSIVSKDDLLSGLGSKQAVVKVLYLDDNTTNNITVPILVNEANKLQLTSVVNAATKLVNASVDLNGKNEASVKSYTQNKEEILKVLNEANSLLENKLAFQNTVNEITNKLANLGINLIDSRLVLGDTVTTVPTDNNETNSTVKEEATKPVEGNKQDQQNSHEGTTKPVEDKKTEQTNTQDEKAKQAEERRKKRYRKRVKRSELAETKVSDSNKLSDVLATILIRRGYGDLL
ncbi:YSIRK-type signal peptide-containing protein [Gemella sanguinis]|uniref:YSIRK-type signal peptide-containing protein n=1 Tax=Gemella sanguinis TaxID=84135 RepID=UPI00068FF10E|nr:YSIRK-type signal peptide-containing protein [Gemella sanguinis]NKZ25489.1 YSIRK-type signal peptide-containing protein [Gemella sanguinis]